MAQQVVVKFLDDLDAANGVETEAAESIKIGFGGNVYALELSQEHLDELYALLDPYTLVGRNEGPMIAGGGKVRRTKPASTGPKTDLAAVREWARANGYEISDRGRIPMEITTAYEASLTAEEPVIEVIPRPKRASRAKADS